MPILLQLLQGSQMQPLLVHTYRAFQGTPCTSYHPGHTGSVRGRG